MELGSIITIGILGAIGIFFLFGFLRGLRKGFYKSLMDIGFVALCLIISIIVSKAITNAFADIEGLREILITAKEKIPDLASTVDSVLEYMDQISDNAAMINVLLALPAALITPIVFIPVYILLGIIIKIPKLIIERVVCGKNGGPNYRGGSRLLGGLVGGVRNALFIVILLVPILGYVGLVGDIVTTVDSVSLDSTGGATNVSSDIAESNKNDVVLLGGSTEMEGGGEGQDFMEMLSPVIDNPAIKGINACGGRLIFNSLTTKKVEGVKIAASKELNIFAELYANAVPLINESPENYGDEQKQGLTNIQTMLKDSEFLTFTVAEGISFVTGKWANGEDAFGIEKIEVGEDYQGLFDGLVESLSNTTPDTVKQDIDTISNLIGTCIDEGVFTELAKEEPDPLKLATNENLLEGVLAEAYKNERIRPIIAEIPNIVVTLMANSIVPEGDTTPKPGAIDMSNITEADVRADAKTIAKVINKIMAFMESTEDLDSSDPNAFIVNADLGSVGAAIDMLRNSALLGDTCQYVLTVMLNSDMVSDLGFVSDDLINKLSDKNVKFENILTSAQKLAVMAISLSQEGINEDNYEEALKFMITEMSPEAADTLKSAISSDALKDFGMSEEEAETMSSTIGSVIDGISSATSDMTEEQIEKEVEAITTIVNTMKDVSATGGNVDADTLFGAEGESVTGITAEELVDTVISSEIVSGAIIGASKNGNEEKVEDPYGIAGSMSESDKTAAEDAIKTYYENNTTGDAESDEALKEKLDAVANILGMDATSWFAA